MLALGARRFLIGIQIYLLISLLLLVLLLIALLVDRVPGKTPSMYPVSGLTFGWISSTLKGICVHEDTGDHHAIAS